MYPRALASTLRAALADTPAVFLHGARQTGKTTLVRELIGKGYPATYLTLDEAGLRAAATADPAGFLAGFGGPVVLDEVQLVPDLFRQIKLEVDRDRRPGRFLLTGSAHLLVLPELADSLVGRLEVQTLWPLSQGEIKGRPETTLDTLFRADTLPTGPLAEDESRAELIERVVRGGFPEAVSRTSPARRASWFEAYVTTLLQRDVRDLANIDGLLELPALLRLLAARSGTLSNTSEISRSSGIARTTLNRYLGLLEGTFLVQRVPAWAANLSKRLVRSPKLVLLDSGLLCHLQGLDRDRLLADPTRFGHVLESFLIQELRKQASWSDTRPHLYHLRTHAGSEIDLLLEDAAGRLIGIEVKSRETVTGKDFRALRAFAEDLGDRFVRGVVFYTGANALPFGKKLHALPISWLWRG